jgi:YggT family protein
MLIPLNQAFQFLVQTFFEIYIFFILLRVIFHWVNIRPTNPILVTISRITHPPLRPIYQLLPRINGVDLAAILLLLVFTMLKNTALFWLQTGFIPPLQGLAVLAFTEILKQFIDIFFYTLIILSLISWFNPLTLAPIIEIIVKISEPLLRPVRALLPPLSGLDFSPLFVMIILKLMVILVVTPLTQISLHLIQSHLH